MADVSKSTDKLPEDRDKKSDRSPHQNDLSMPKDFLPWHVSAATAAGKDTNRSATSAKPEYITKAGETISSIAQAVLGQKASSAELERVIHKLESANHVAPDQKFSGEVELKIPSSLAKLFAVQSNSRHAGADDAIVFTPDGHQTLYSTDKKTLRNPFSSADIKHLDEKAEPSAALKVDERPADNTSAVKDVEALRGFLSEPDKAIKLLSARSDAQRAEIENVYKSLHSQHTLDDYYARQLNDTQLAEFRGALHRKDGDISSQNSDRVFSALTEAGNGSWSGRSMSQIEKDLRDSARTGDPQQMRADYLRDHGRDIIADVASNSGISAETKDAFRTYMERGPNGPDYSKIARQAVKAQNLDMFAEAMQDPNARAEYRSPEGQQLLKDNFGRYAQQAQDLSQIGKFSTDHQLDKSSGAFGTDTKTVDMSMKLMTPQEVSNYFIGKNQTDSTVKLSADDTTRLAGMTAEEKQVAKEFYAGVHAHLLKLARSDGWNASEADVRRWEDLAATKNGSLVGELQKHWGRIYNSGIGEIKNDIASMSQKDWADGRAHPERRDQLQHMLVALNKSPEVAASTLELYDKKIAEGDWSKADRVGRGDVLLEKLDSNWRALSRNDRRGVIADLMEAARRDPALREHLQHPDTDEDRAFAKQFQEHVTGLVGDDIYKKVVQPFIDNGSIPLEQCAKWNFNSETVGQHLNPLHTEGDDLKPDIKFSVDSIGQASAEDKRRLLSSDPVDQEFREKIFRGMSADEREVAIAAARQSDGVHDEDRLRLAIIQANGADSVDDTIGSIGVTDKTRAGYAKKYDASLDADALKGASDTTKVQRALSSENDAVSKFNQAREEASQTRSGFGDWFATRIYGSAADAQLNDATNQNADLMIAAQKISTNVSSADLQKMIDTMQQAVDNNKEAKAAAGEFVKNSAIAVGTVVTVIASGGTASVPLVAAFAGSGAVLNAGSKKLLEGNDYSPTLGQLGQDLAVGGLSGAVNAIGPAQFIKVLSFAGTAVKEGVTATVASTIDLPGFGLKLSGEEIFSPTAANDLNRAATKIMHESLISGAKRLDNEALTKAVDQAVPAAGTSLTEAERNVVVQEITKRLERNITEQMVKESQRVFGNAGAVEEGALMSNFQRIKIRAGMNGLAGAGASGITSGSDAAVKFDPSKGLGTNMENILGATITGATTGFLFGAGAGEGMAGLMHSLKAKPHLADAPPEVPAQPSVAAPKVEPSGIPEYKWVPTKQAAEAPAPSQPELKIDDDEWWKTIKGGHTNPYAVDLGSHMGEHGGLEGHDGHGDHSSISAYLNMHEMAHYGAHFMPAADESVIQKLSALSDETSTNSHLFTGEAIQEATPRSVRSNDIENDLSIFPKIPSYSNYERLRLEYTENRPQFTGLDSTETIENAWQQNKGKLSELIAEKLNENVMPEATFDSPLKFYTGDHLETAKAILDQAAAYATDYGIMKSLRSVKNQIVDGGVDSLYYYAATPDSLANMAAYTVRKVAKSGTQIQYFDSKAGVADLLGEHPLVIFGDLSKMSPEQKVAFTTAMTNGKGLNVEKIAVVDTSAFERLPTALDYAKGQSAVRQKMDAIIEQTDKVMKANPGLSRTEAINQAIYEPNSKVIAELNAARGTAAPITEIRPTPISREEIFSQRANADDIQKFFESKFGSNAVRERIFAAELVGFDAKFPSYGEMTKGMQALKEGLDVSARKNGLDPAKDLYLVNVEDAGSSEASMMSLYVAANDIPAQQVVTKRQLQEMADKGLIKDRRVVALDDCIYSGTQWNSNLNFELPPHRYPNVAVGTLATYSRYAKDFYAKALVSAAEKEGIGPQDTVLLNMKYRYALNAEQMASLKWSQVNIDSGELALKGIPKRPLEMDDQSALAILKSQSHSEYVFSGLDGIKNSGQALSERIDLIKASIPNPNFSRDIVTNEVLISRNPSHDTVSYPRAPYAYRHAVKSLLVGDINKSGFKDIASLLQFPAMNADNRPAWFASFVDMKDAAALGQPYHFSKSSDFYPSMSRRDAAKIPSFGSGAPKHGNASDLLINTGIPISVKTGLYAGKMNSSEMPTAVEYLKESFIPTANKDVISQEAKAAASLLHHDKSPIAAAALAAAGFPGKSGGSFYGLGVASISEKGADLSYYNLAKFKAGMSAVALEKVGAPKDSTAEVISVKEIATQIGKVPTAAEFKAALNGASVGKLPEALSSTGLPEKAVFKDLDKLAKALRSLDTVLPPQKKFGLGAVDLKIPEFNIMIGNQKVAVKKIGIGEVAHVYKLTVDGESFAFKVPNDPERMDVHGSFAETGALAYLSSLKTPPSDLAKFYAGNPGQSGGWMLSDFIDQPMIKGAGGSVSDALAKKGLFLGDNWSANVGPGGVIWDVGGIEPMSLVNKPKPKTLEEFEGMLKDPDFRTVAGRRLAGIKSQSDLKSAMNLVLDTVPESGGQVSRSINLLHSSKDKFDVLMKALQTPGAAGRAAFEIDQLEGQLDEEGRSYATMLYNQALQNPECRVEAVKQIDKLPENDRYTAFMAAWEYPEARPMATRAIPSIPDVGPPEAPFTMPLRLRARQKAYGDPGASYVLSKKWWDLNDYLTSQGLINANW